MQKAIIVLLILIFCSFLFQQPKEKMTDTVTIQSTDIPAGLAKVVRRHPTLLFELDSTRQQINQKAKPYLMMGGILIVGSLIGGHFLIRFVSKN